MTRGSELRDVQNAHAEWQRQGRPEDPTPDQLARLHEGSRLTPFAPPARVAVGPSGLLHLEFSLPMFGLSLLEVSPVAS